APRAAGGGAAVGPSGRRCRGGEPGAGPGLRRRAPLAPLGRHHGGRRRLRPDLARREHAVDLSEAPRRIRVMIHKAPTIDDPAYFARLAEVEAAHWWSTGM